MKKWIYIFYFLLLFSSCLKDTPADVSSVQFKVFDEMLRCEPVAVNGRFRYIASNDSMVYLSQIDTMGTLKHLVNYTSKFMSDITLNKYSDSVYLLPANNGANYTLIFYTKLTGTKIRCFKLIKTDAQGTVLFQTADSLTRVGPEPLDFKKIVYNANTDGVCLISTFSTNGVKDQLSSVQMVNFDSNGMRTGTFELSITVGREPYFIGLADGTVGVLSGEIQGNGPGIKTQNFWIIDQNSNVVSEMLNLSATPGLITSAIQTKDRSTIIFSSISIDQASGSVAGNISKITLASKTVSSAAYYPKAGLDLHYFNCIGQNNSDFLFIGNLDKTPATMSWATPYSQNDEAQIGWVLFNKDYEPSSKGNLTSSLSFLGVGVSLICNDSQSFYGLAIKKSFNNYDNVVYFKTKIKGL